MVRKRQQPVGNAMLGRPVRAPAKFWGEAWAREEYGDDWDTAELEGTVTGHLCSGTNAARPWQVTWEDGAKYSYNDERLQGFLVPKDDGSTAGPLGKPAAFFPPLFCPFS